MTQLQNSTDTANHHGRVMDIAFFIDPGMLAGEAAFVRHLVMGLKSEGQKVTFIAPQGTDLNVLPILGSRVLTYRWNRWEKLPVLQKLRLNAVARELNNFPPDVLVVWGSAELHGGGAVQVLSQMAPGIPAVVWCWDAVELFTPLVKMKSVRHVITSSQAIAARVPAHWTCPITVVHPGVYCDETLACYDVAGQLPCLVSLDPLSHRGAYEALLRACRMLAERGQDYLLFAYDTGRKEYSIWQMAENLGLLDRVSFVPFQQDAEPLLLHGDLYIHILPVTRVQYRTLEAMGRGLAIISCPNHGADYLMEGQTCRVVGPQTAEAWRDVLLELTRDRGKAAALAKRGQQYVREKHSLGRTLEQFGSICRQAAGIAIPLGR